MNTTNKTEFIEKHISVNYPDASDKEKTIIRTAIDLWIAFSRSIVPKRITVALMRDLEKQMDAGEISYSRMVEILNETFFAQEAKPALPSDEEIKEWANELCLYSTDESEHEQAFINGAIRFARFLSEKEEKTAEEICNCAAPETLGRYRYGDSDYYKCSNCGRKAVIQEEKTDKS